MILKSLPDGFLDGLLDEDCAAIRRALGKRVKIVPVGQCVYPDDDTVEVMWRDRLTGDLHTIWISPDHLALP